MEFNEILFVFFYIKTIILVYKVKKKKTFDTRRVNVIIKAFEL